MGTQRRDSYDPRATLQVRLHYPNRHTVVVQVAGDIDTATAHHLADLLTPRLTSSVTTVLIDLTGVRFLDGAGLDVLYQAQHRARTEQKHLGLITGPTCVHTALHAAGLTEEFATYPDLTTALDETPGIATRNNRN